MSSKECCKVGLYPKLTLPVLIFCGWVALYVASFEPLPRQHYFHGFRESFLFGVVRETTEPETVTPNLYQNAVGEYVINCRLRACHDDANFAGKTAGVMTTFFMLVGSIIASVAFAVTAFNTSKGSK